MSDLQYHGLSELKYYYFTKAYGPPVLEYFCDICSSMEQFLNGSQTKWICGLIFLQVVHTGLEQERIDITSYGKSYDRHHKELLDHSHR